MKNLMNRGNHRVRYEEALGEITFKGESYVCSNCIHFDSKKKWCDKHNKEVFDGTESDKCKDFWT